MELLAIAGLIGPLELLEGWVVEVFAPEALHEHTLFYLKLLGEETCKSVQSEGPAEVSRAEGHCAVGGVHLEGFTSLAVLVGGDDHIGVLDDAAELLVHGLSVVLQLEDAAVDLVDHEDWFNSF